MLVQHMQENYLKYLKTELLPACFPWIRNPSYIGMECLLNFWEIEVHFRVPLGAGIICSGHPWLSSKVRESDQLKQTL
jgi:hypothetical protein